MRDISNKADNIGDTLPAADFNALKNENQNFVESADITLDAEGGPDTSTDMLANAAALYSAAADFYADSGAANAYVLTRSTNLKPVVAYKDGLVAIFVSGNTNTGASTVNITSLGVKSITLPDGTALSGGEIISGEYIELRYNLSNDRFHIILKTTILPRGYIDGLVMSNNSGDTQHDIDVDPGECKATNLSLNMSIASTFTKRIDANWAAATGNGGFPSGLTLTADTWYHYFMIGKSDGSQFDFGYDTSLTATNLLSDASGFTAYRRIGSVLTDGSSNIISFFQYGNRFYWGTPINDFNGAAPTSRSLVTLSVPNGVVLEADVSLASSDCIQYLYPPDLVDITPAAGAALSLYFSSPTGFGERTFSYTNTSSQVYHKSTNNNTTNIVTYGWIDPRGKNA